MNRSVLIVTPYFAPQTHAAVFRAYKLAKYLPRFGWKPYVLTVDRNYLYNEDPALLDDLPEEVEIHRARYIEPTPRGLRMALGGRDRTFAALKNRGELNSTRSDSAAVATRPSTASRFRSYVQQRWLNDPDAYWTWHRPAVRLGRRLIREHRIPLVFTSANPYTCHGIGLALQSSGCRWVADLRDPHTYCHHMHSQHPKVFARQRRLEREAVNRADAVTVASSAIAMILSDTYGTEGARRAHFIPTGLDEDLIPDPSTSKPRPYPYLLFSGEFLPDYGAEFLEIFAASLSHPDVRERGVKLLVAGRAEVNGPRILPHVRRLDIEEQVELLDHMPQGELYALLQGAEAGVLLSGRRYLWWCLNAKMVDYIALRKPVVSLVPDPSEARSRLTAAGLGVFLDGDREACVQRLEAFLGGRLELTSPNEDECNLYLAMNQTRSFTDIFDGVLQ